MADTFDSQIVITEMTGRKRVVVLRGGGLPFQGAKWGGNLRVRTTWYPGNSAEATQSVMGPTEKPTSWQGMWRTTMLMRSSTVADINGDGTWTDITRADVLRDLLETIFRDGQKLSVVWRNQIALRPKSQLERVGRCSDWEFDYDRADDIGWTMTWDWKSRGGMQQKIARLRDEGPAPDMDELMTAAEKLAQQVNMDFGLAHDALSVATQSFSLDSLANFVNAPGELLKGFAGDITQIINRLKTIGDLIKQVRALPTSLYGQILAVANTAVSTANNFVDAMSQPTPESLVTNASASQLMGAVGYYGDAMTQADLMRDKALALRDQIKSAAQGQKTILAIYMVRGSVVQGFGAGAVSGELLTSISLSYYGNADQTATIAKANGLPLNQQFVQRGTILIIPVLSSSTDFTPGGG